jgi:hypothetical protein
VKGRENKKSASTMMIPMISILEQQKFLLPPSVLLHHGDCQESQTLRHRSLMLRVIRVQVLFVGDFEE